MPNAPASASRPSRINSPVLTTEHVAKTVAEVDTDDAFSAAAYLLSATELRTLD
jgi:hypothetical protein